MTTATAPVSAAKAQQEPSAGSDSAPAAHACGASPGTSDAQAVYWGDRFAFAFWLACFALLALIVAYDAITGLFRWAGSN